MDDLRFQWDDAKAESNIKKHGISFEEARTVFSDDFARVIPDPDGSYGEERFIIPGQSSAMKLLVVCHCCRDYENFIFLISARKADKCERDLYEGFKNA